MTEFQIWGFYVCIDTSLQNNFLLNLETQKQILFPSNMKLIFCVSFEVSTALYQDYGLWDVKYDAGRAVLNIWKVCTAFTFKITVFSEVLLFSFRMSWIIFPVTECHIPEDKNLWFSVYGKPKSKFSVHVSSKSDILTTDTGKK
jgi:hypothetical protein